MIWFLSQKFNIIIQMKGKGKKEKESTDSDDSSHCPLQFLDFKPIDHMRQCPRFTASLTNQSIIPFILFIHLSIYSVVERNEDTISSEDLDLLQLELETLLVSVVKRQRLLQTEMEALVNWYDVKNRDKRSPNKAVNYYLIIVFICCLHLLPIFAKDF